MQLGLSQNGYCKIENGKVELKVKTLQLIAQVLEVEMYQLFSNISGRGEVLYHDIFFQQRKGKQALSEGERELYGRLLAIKDLHLTTQQKLLIEYEEEIKQLRLRAKKA